MEFRSELTCALTKIIRNGNLTHAAIANRAGTSRTRVTAIANRNTQGISTDLLIRVLSATGHRAELRVRRAAGRFTESCFALCAILLSCFSKVM
jgi:predicted XRE-type DNA-binding protein